MTELLARNAGQWTYEDLLTALAIIFVGIIVRFIITGFVAKKAMALTQKTDSKADDIAIKAVVSPLGNVVILVAVYLALRTLASEYPLLLERSRMVFDVILTIMIAGVVLKLIDAASLFFIGLANRTETSFDDQIVPLLRKTAKVFVCVITFITVLQNLGVSIAGMVAGLGIGGLALAMAAKDTLANLFGSVTILIDRPFKVGDIITTGSSTGTVSEIGLRSTRIKTFDKTMISIPNAEMANATVENTSVRPRRKVSMQIGLTYDTTPDQIRQVLSGIEKLLVDHPGVDPEDQNVRFTNFGDSTLDIDFKYFTIETGYDGFSQVKQEISLSIMDLLDGMNVDMAFPTQTVYLEKD
ncbi:mechanosensitive ion channel family protein [bacterium]|jgi:MscS family membrane protein|nr:mechanosensitive ion channel family protein [bacterium]MBT4291424.1 mechanosensitive ion channel family protein [bacterium]